MLGSEVATMIVGLGKRMLAWGPGILLKTLSERYRPTRMARIGANLDLISRSQICSRGNDLLPKRVYYSAQFVYQSGPHLESPSFTEGLTTASQLVPRTATVVGRGKNVRRSTSTP